MFAIAVVKIMVEIIIHQFLQIYNGVNALGSCQNFLSSHVFQLSIYLEN